MFEPLRPVVAVSMLRGSPSVAFEIPKSSTLSSGRPSLPCTRNRFAGLTSWWTMPRTWASASPSHAWITYSAARWNGSGPVPTSAASVLPSSSSMTMKGP